MKVLNIDDSTINNMLMENLLNEHGFETLSVIEGSRTKEKIREFQPDVILLDLMMPDKSGVEILEELNRENINIPVIVISAMDATDVKKKISQLGAKYQFQKPVDFQVLMRSIQEVVENQKSYNL